MTKLAEPFEKPAYFEQALFLYIKYAKFLEDDFAHNELNILDFFLNLVKSTYFKVFVENEVVSGFVYLDNFVGNIENLHSAEITTCFDKKFWGDYTKQCGLKFLEICFRKLNLKKVKALVYPENFRVKTLLKSIGFEKEALLKAETMRNGELQDVEIYTIRR